MDNPKKIFNFEDVQREVQGDYVELIGDGKVTCRKTCSVTRTVYEVQVPSERFLAWRRGGMIQDVMYNLTPEQREFLISRQTPAEFEALFADEE